MYFAADFQRREDNLNPMRRICACALLVFAASFFSKPALAQSTRAIQLTVDATHAPQKILHVRLSMPVRPGPLTLYYPKWIPGEHGPDGPISNLTGLKFQVDGKDIPWQRDLLDVFTFHVDVPAGATHLDATYDYLETGRGSATDKILSLNWNEVALYPEGTPAGRLIYATTLRLPEGWKCATSLQEENRPANAAGNQISFQPISLDLLVDSPVLAGEYFRVIDLTPPGEPIHHEIDLAADSEAALAMSPEIQNAMTSLVAESGRLFGARHYRRYHFLLALSDHMAHFGLERHESSENRLGERTLLGPDAGMTIGSLLPHEFAHSWNGKFRRPADLTVPYYQAPMKTDLLWLYEGLTDYLGPLLAARSGLWTPEQYREFLASIAASLGPGRPGRTWRPLLDTAVAEPGIRSGPGWFNWHRGTDYYDEGDLLWLEAATILHGASNNSKSIDDFCHTFHGGANNGPEVKTYTFDDVVQILNGLAPYNWSTFFDERLNSTSAAAPAGGIENGGWKLIFNSEAQKLPGRRGKTDDVYSLGLQLGDDGTVNDSIVGGAAYEAGITSGMRVVGVNGRVYSHQLLEDAMNAAQSGQRPIMLLVVNEEYYRTISVNYEGGARYPHLLRDQSKPDYLDELIQPRAGMN